MTPRAGGSRPEDDHHVAVVAAGLPNRPAVVEGLDETVLGEGLVVHSSRLDYIDLEEDLGEDPSPAAVDCMEDGPGCREGVQEGHSIAVAEDTLDLVEGIHRRGVGRMTCYV